MRRHEAGHERWDRKGIKERNAHESYKRRKVNLESESSSSPSTLSWTSANHNDLLRSDHSVQRAQDANFSTSGNAAIGHEPSAVSQHFGQNEAISGGYRTAPGHAPIYQTRDHSKQMPNEPYSHYQLTSEKIHQFHQFDSMHTSFIPFDFSSFLLPTNMEQPPGNECFSYDFYSAMRETGNPWTGLGDIVDSHMLTPYQEYGTNLENHTGPPLLNGNPFPVEQVPEVNGGRSSQETADVDPHNYGESISRVSSPPNEASEEDKWPFQWNPSSTPILKAHAITIPDNHPLFQAHYSRFDISDSTLLRLRAFLKPPSGREYHQSQKGSFVLPSLPIVNVFIRLFFEHFSPQMPVLHHVTVDTNTNLPLPLLGTIITIGAIYSHLKQTRRFAIVLLDIVRWHLQIAVECDNSLMRDPMIIYAEALICHTGLWCGNKRAFELAEVVRGSLVTHIRRVQFGEQLVTSEKESPSSDGKRNLHTEWRKWVGGESRRRLAWVVYAIDYQFPSLLNFPSTISIGEVCNLGCPCDDEFWSATSARNWKNMLGPASVPPSRSFSAAVGPFILETLIPRPEQFRGDTGRPNLARIGKHLPILSLNPWSTFLVLLAIQSQIFEFSQESLITQTFMGGDESSDEEENSGHDNEQAASSGGYEDGLGKILRKLKERRRFQLAGLSLFLVSPCPS